MQRRVEHMPRLPKGQPRYRAPERVTRGTTDRRRSRTRAKQREKEAGTAPRNVARSCKRDSRGTFSGPHMSLGCPSAVPPFRTFAPLHKPRPGSTRLALGSLSFWHGQEAGGRVSTCRGSRARFPLVLPWPFTGLRVNRRGHRGWGRLHKMVGWFLLVFLNVPS